MSGTDVGGESAPLGDRVPADPLAVPDSGRARADDAGDASVGAVTVDGVAAGGPDGVGGVADDAAPTAGTQDRSFVRELPFLIVVALVLALVIKALLVQAFYIPSESMQQTLQERDRVLVNKLVYRFRDVRRGEVVVFDGEGSFTSPDATFEPVGGTVERALRSAAAAVGLGASDEKDFIKRVIGVQGDRVACCTDGRVTVQPRGAEDAVALIEPYVYSVSGDTEPFCEAGLGAENCPAGAPGVLVPEGRIWVMGDHRDASQDSRAYMDNDDSGTVSVDEVIGRAFVIVWPLDRVRLLDVPDGFQQVRDASAAAADGPAVGAVAGGGIGGAYGVGIGGGGGAPVTALRLARHPVRIGASRRRGRRGGGHCGATTGT